VVRLHGIDHKPFPGILVGCGIIGGVPDRLRSFMNIDGCQYVLWKRR